MKILQVIAMFLPSTAYGGPTTVCLAQSQALQRAGRQVEVATTALLSLRPAKQSLPHLSEKLGFPVRYFSARVIGRFLPSIFSLSYLQWLRRRAYSYDVVHVHFAREALPVLTCAFLKAMKINYVVQPHGMLNTSGRFKDWFDALITRRVLESAAAVLALQDHERCRLLQVAPNAHLVMVPNGLDTAKWPYRWEIERLQAHTVLFLARLHPRKRVLDFLEAARLLKAQGHVLNYRIVGDDGGDLTAARTKIQRDALSDCVVLVGSRSPDQCAQEMAQASVYVLPSVDEPFPMSVLEALAVGVPSVVTTGMHIRTLLEEHDAAEVVPVSDPQALADGIIKLLQNPQLAEQRSRRGRRLIEEHLDIDQVAHSLHRVYLGEEV